MSDQQADVFQSDLSLLTRRNLRGLVASILRFHSSIRNDTADATWSSVKIATYGIAESNLYLIASCLPTYHVFLSYFRELRNRVSTQRRTDPTTVHSRGATALDQSDVQLKSLTKAAEGMGLGNVVVAKGHAYNSDDTRLVDDVGTGDEETGSITFKARTPHADGIKVTSDFIVTTDLRK